MSKHNAISLALILTVSLLSACASEPEKPAGEPTYHVNKSAMYQKFDAEKHDDDMEKDLDAYRERRDAEKE